MSQMKMKMANAKETRKKQHKKDLKKLKNYAVKNLKIHKCTRIHHKATTNTHTLPPLSLSLLSSTHKYWGLIVWVLKLKVLRNECIPSFL